MQEANNTPQKSPEPRVLVLTAGVDVNERALVYEVVGWGRGYESFGIEFDMIPGNPREPHVWQQLDHLVHSRKFRCSDGAEMYVRRMAVDSGFLTDYVYRYVQKHWRAIAVKGVADRPGVPFIYGIPRHTKGVRVLLQLLNVDRGKEDVIYRFDKIQTPGAGYCHFPGADKGYDEEYFRELKAEELIATSTGGSHTLAWKKVSQSRRNEALDVRVYAYAALLISKVNLETMERDIVQEDPGTSDPSGEIQFGAQKMQGLGDLLSGEPAVTVDLLRQMTDSFWFEPRSPERE